MFFMLLKEVITNPYKLPPLIILDGLGFLNNLLNSFHNHAPKQTHPEI